MRFSISKQADYTRAKNQASLECQVGNLKAETPKVTSKA